MNRLRRAILTSCLCAGFALAAIAQTPAPATPAAPAQPAGPQPKAVFKEIIFDFGEANVNSVHSHDFEVRNEGKADLVIQNIVPGCACTAVSGDPIVKPGHSGVIHTALDTSGMAGALAKQIAVFTNDPAASRTILTLQVTIKPHTTNRPDTLRIKGIQHEQAMPAHVLVWALDRDDLQVTKIESPYPYVKVTYREAKGDENDPDGRGRQWFVEATLSPDAPVGALAALVRVYTNHPTDSVVAVPITGFQRPLLVVTPPNADLDDVQAGPNYLRVLRLENFGATPVSVTAATSDVKGVTIDTHPIGDGKRIEVSIHLAGDMPKGRFRGTIVLSTTSPAVPKIEIPISGNVL